MIFDRRSRHADNDIVSGIVIAVGVAAMAAVWAWALHGLYVEAFVMIDADPAECAASRALLYEEFKTRYLLAGGTSTSEPAMLELWKQTEWERQKSRSGQHSLLPPATPECERRMPSEADEAGGPAPP